jgi:arylsulfatase A-like enzyme
MIILDTLRADTLDLDATRPAPLPSLRAFSARSTAFVDAIAPAAWTPQSLPSILTGLTPPHTGCQGTPESGVPALPGGVTTLAERLRALGYVTAAFTGGGFVSASQGLAQGFDTFVSSFDTLGPEACLKTWSTRPAPAAPFFLLLHSYAPHDPYGEKDARALSSAAPPAWHRRRRSAACWRCRVARQARRARPTWRALREPACSASARSSGTSTPPRESAGALLESLADPTKVLRSALRRFIDGGYLSDPRGRTDVESRFRTAYRNGLAPVDAMLARTFAALDAARLPRTRS